MSTPNQQKKKVLFLITKSNWGGAQRYVFDMATNLPPADWEVTVALGGDGELRTRLESADVRVLGIPHLERDISLKKELLASRSIAHLIRVEDPDILHLNSSKAGAIGALIGRLHRVPAVVFTAHGWAFNEDRGWLSRTILKTIHWLTILLAHRTIAVSEAVRQQMNWLGAKGKMTVVHLGRTAPNFLDRLSARAALSRQLPALAPYQNDYWSLTIGELHPVKQHHIAIEAVAELVTKHHNLRHLIIGDGERRAELNDVITAHNLHEHVFLLGHIDEAAQYLKAADVFVLPSRSEALGYVLIEAANAQLPRVASNVGGIPEMITDGVDGTLVPSSDPVTLAQAVATYKTEPDVAAAHGQSALTHSKCFTTEAMVTNIVTLYTELLSTKDV